jgi:hypothetical protein
LTYSAYKIALIPLTGYQAPAAMRRCSRARLTTWLANYNVRDADTVAAIAMEAVQAQQTALRGENVAAQILADLAAQILGLHDRLKPIDKQIRDVPRASAGGDHRVPARYRPILGAEFVVTVGDLSARCQHRKGVLARRTFPAPYRLAVVNGASARST